MVDDIARSNFDKIFVSERYIRILITYTIIIVNILNSIATCYETIEYNYMMFIHQF